MSVFAIFALYWSCFIMLVVGQSIMFKRKFGYLDAISEAETSRDTSWYIQEAPIYGLEYNSDGDVFRFLTVRQGNTAVVMYSNNWVVRTASNRFQSWSLKCPKNMLITSVCSDFFICRPIKLLCGKVSKGFRIIASKKKVVRSQSSQSTVVCPDGMYAQGLEGFGPFYDIRGLFCVELYFQYTVKNKVPLLTYNNRLVISDEFSSDGEGYSERMNGPIHAVGCLFASNCGIMQLYSTERGINKMFASDASWISSASTEGSSVSCPKGKLIQAMRCETQNCAKVSIECNRLADNSRYVVDSRFQQRSSPFSSFGSFLTVGTCPDGYYANRLDCLHDGCVVMVLGCAKVSIIE